MKMEREIPNVAMHAKCASVRKISIIWWTSIEQPVLFVCYICATVVLGYSPNLTTMNKWTSHSQRQWKCANLKCGLGNVRSAMYGCVCVCVRFIKWKLLAMVYGACLRPNMTLNTAKRDFLQPTGRQPKHVTNKMKRQQTPTNSCLSYISVSTHKRCEQITNIGTSAKTLCQYMVAFTEQSTIHTAIISYYDACTILEMTIFASIQCD